MTNGLLKVPYLWTEDDTKPAVGFVLADNAQVSDNTVKLRIEQPDGTVVEVAATDLGGPNGQFEFTDGDLVAGLNQLAQVEAVDGAAKIQTSESFLIDVQAKLGAIAPDQRLFSATPSPTARQISPELSDSRLIIKVEGQSLQLGFFAPLGVGESNQAANVGTGAGVFRDKTGAVLNLRSLKGIGGLVTSVSGGGDEVEIDGSALSGGGPSGVNGPSTTTDNAVVRWDGAFGGLVQNSLVVVDDTGNISLPASATVDGRDVSADGIALDSHTANTSNPHSVTAAQVAAVPAAEKGAVNGVAELDAGGTVPDAQISALITRDTELNAHVNNVSNPHVVTPAQVGNAIAQWNANRLQGNNISVAAPATGQALVWDGLQWEPQTPAGGGNVLGPGAATDREIAVFDGGPTLLDNPPATIDNAGNLSTVGTVTASGIALGSHAADHEAGGGQVLTAQDLDSGAAAVGQLMESDGGGAWNLIPTPSTVMLTTLVVRKGSAGTIAKCRPVYISGWNVGGWHEVEEAEADVAASMPAIGLSREPITNAADAEVVTFGHILGCDTSSWAVKDPLYVARTAGGLVNSKATLTGAATRIQKVGLVARVDAVNGEIIVVGAGRSNDIPNLGQDKVWKGDANGQPQETDFPSADILFGANGLTATTTTRYLYPGFADSTAQTSVIQRRMARAGTLSNLYMLQNVPAGNGSNIVYTVRKNGVPTLLAVTMASDVSTGEDTSNTVSVVAGDLIDIEVTKAVSVGTSPSDIIAAMDFS